MDFERLLNALLGELNRRVHNGLITERGLARVAGLSQPHVHHILSGKRRLTAPVADRLMAAASIDLGDLMATQITRHATAGQARETLGTELSLLVPMLVGTIGPGFVAPVEAKQPQAIPVPGSLIPPGSRLCAARVGHDVRIEGLFAAGDVVIIALEPLSEALAQERPSLVMVMERGGSWHIDPKGIATQDDAADVATALDSAPDTVAVGAVILSIRQWFP